MTNNYKQTTFGLLELLSAANKLEISALHCPVAIIWLAGDMDGDGDEAVCTMIVTVQ